jgi:phage/plasmid-like protein (TIGR03299 family)
MAHELEMVSGKASMFFVGETPWHGLGTKIEHNLTSEEAIVAAGLDWEVGLKDLYTRREDGNVDEQVDHRATYRLKDNKILGVVGPTWKPLQNKDAFGFFDAFVAAGQATYNTAGALRGGRRVWILAKLGGELVISGDDIVEKYLLLSNSHDGSLAIRVGFTPVRVVCANTLAAAHSANQSSLIKITHHGNAKNALDSIADVMNVVNRKFEATAEQYRMLAAKGCSEADLKKYVNLVFAEKRVKDAIAAAALDEKELTAEDLRSNVYPKVLDLFETGRGTELPGVKGTLWGAYNAINEYITHERGGDGANEKRLDSTWFGQGFVQNTRALKVGVDMAKVAA